MIKSTIFGVRQIQVQIFVPYYCDLGHVTEPQWVPILSSIVFFSVIKGRRQWNLMDLFGTSLSFCCALNALWREMKCRYLNVASKFTQHLWMANVFLFSFTHPYIAVHLWRAWSHMQGILEVSRAPILPSLLVQWEDQYAHAWRQHSDWTQGQF